MRLLSRTAVQISRGSSQLPQHRLAGIALCAGFLLLSGFSTEAQTPFTRTYTFNNSLDLACCSLPYNYGFTDLVQDTSISASNVQITSIAISGSISVASPDVNGAVGFDWDVFIGPSSFGFAAGQVSNSSAYPGSITSNAPTLFLSALGSPARPGTTIAFGDEFNFQTNKFTTNNPFFNFKEALTSPMNLTNGLYLQVLAWSGAVNIHLILSNVQVIVTGTATSGPIGSPLLGGSGTTTNPTASFAEPVNTATGNYFSSHTDLTVAGRGFPFVFNRYYNSLDSSNGPLGIGWNHSYNVVLNRGPGGQVTIKQADGSTVTFSNRGGGAYSAATPGLFDTLVQNSGGSLILTRKDRTSLTFSPAGRLANVIDRNGNMLTLNYDSSGNLTSIIDTSGRAFLLTYDGSSHLTSLTDPSGRVVRYVYDASGNLASNQDTLGGTTQYSYDPNHRMISTTDQRGVMYVQNNYDSQGRVISQTDARRFTTTFAYNTPASGVTTIIDPLGNVTKHIYDPNNRIVEIVNAQIGATNYTYDANNDRTAVKDANGNVTQFVYDSNGNIISVLDALGHISSFKYDAQNDILAYAEPAGNTTTFVYDSKGNLISIQDVLGNKTTLAYDSLGQMITRTNGIGNTTSLSYDQFGDLTQISDGLGNKTRFEYDWISRLVSVIDGNEDKLSLTYDALSRRTSVTDAQGDQTKFIYDPVGNLLELIDANGNQTSYRYDNIDNLIRVTDALGRITSYEYDANNNRVSLTNAKHNKTEYRFDSLNRRTQVIDPLGFVTIYAYDAVGNMVSSIDANGKASGITYDALNRPTTRSYADGNTIGFSYDKNGNRVSMADLHGVTSYQYDDLDRVIAVTSPGGAEVKYGYDAIGHRTSLTYPDGRLLNYTYDAANRLSQLKDWYGMITSYTYDAAGNRTHLTLGNGATSAYTYDKANRLLSIVNRFGPQIVSSFDYALDAVGNRTQLSSKLGVTNFKYDALNRLVSWTPRFGQTVSYAYDEVGNRSSLTRSGSMTPYTYDADDRLVTAGPASFTHDGDGNHGSLIDSGSITAFAHDAGDGSESDGLTSFTYDGNGNRLTKITGETRTRYTYDGLDRLTSVSGPGIATHYLYDGDGNRISTQSGVATVDYVNDVLRRRVSVLSTKGPDETFDYQYGLSLVSGDGTEGEHFYQTDGLGSIVNISGNHALPAATLSYDPWGNLKNPRHPLGDDEPFKFTGEVFDQRTGLYNLRTRYYDPTVGRFLSRDPIGLIVGSPFDQNRYTYARNNPLRYVDPSGLASEAPVASDPTRAVRLFGGFAGIIVGGINACRAIGGCGFTFGGSGFGGVGLPGSAATWSVGCGIYQSGVGCFRTTGSFFGGGNGVSVGGAASVGTSFYVTNAASNQQLSGPFTSTVVDVGSYEGQYSYGSSSFGDVGVASIGSGFGGGYGFSSYTTNTDTWSYNWNSDYIYQGTSIGWAGQDTFGDAAVIAFLTDTATTKSERVGRGQPDSPTAPHQATTLALHK